jgi:hypothetical protein
VAVVNRLVMRVVGLLVVGAALLWLYAGTKGWSKDWAFCYGGTSGASGCGEATAWSGHRILWLVPALVVGLLLVLYLAGAAGRSHAALGTLVLVLGLAGLVTAGAAGADASLSAECSAVQDAATRAMNANDPGLVASTIVTQPQCFAPSDVAGARSFLQGG